MVNCLECKASQMQWNVRLKTGDRPRCRIKHLAACYFIRHEHERFKILSVKNICQSVDAIVYK